MNTCGKGSLQMLLPSNSLARVANCMVPHAIAYKEKNEKLRLLEFSKSPWSGEHVALQMNCKLSIQDTFSVTVIKKLR